MTSRVTLLLSNCLRVPSTSVRNSVRTAKVNPNFGDISSDRTFFHNIEKPRKVRVEVEKDETLEKFFPKPSQKKRIEVSRTSHQIPPGELYTQYWDKNKYQNDWIKINRKTKSKSGHNDGCSVTWSDFCPDLLDMKICSNASRLGGKRPTPLQRNVVRAWNTTRHLFVLGETGSGKTFSYLLPLLSKVEKSVSNGKAYRAVILQPTKALVLQTCDVARKLAADTTVRISSTEDYGISDWDVLIATPGRFQKLSRKPSFDSENIKKIVLDEADQLLDDSFVADMTNIFSILPIRETKTENVRSDGASLVFVSAIKSEEVENTLDQLVDRRNLQFVVDEDSHKLQDNIDFIFIRMKEIDKIERLADICAKDLERGKENRSIIFCKDNDTVTFVVSQLQKKGILASRDLEARIIVATDSLARGFDSPTISHVINFDSPIAMDQFLLRSGRVGRLSSRFAARCTTFVRTKSQVELLKRLESIARREKSRDF